MINKIVILIVAIAYSGLIVYLLTNDTPKLWSGFALILLLVPIVLHNRKGTVPK